MTSELPRVAIAGGGFSGTLILANLVARADAPLEVELFEPDEPAKGAAYGTAETAHLLNVRADRMGAFDGRPGHFYEWLETGEGKAAAAKHGYAPSPDSFAPRMVFAAYLKHILDEALVSAKQKNIAVNIHRTLLVDAEITGGKLSLALQTGGRLSARALALATGNAPPRRFAFGEKLGGRYVADTWKAGDAFPRGVDKLSAHDTVAIIGTGLTAIDAVLTLMTHGFPGKVAAISRHGHLPAAHAPFAPHPAWEWVTHPEKAPKTAREMCRDFRREIARAGEWRAAVDSLRPVTQTLWQRLSDGEKRKFMRHLFTLWNVHRHRMAPEIAAQLSALEKSGRLEILAGKILDAGPQQDGMSISWRPRGRAEAQTLKAALLLNCTGPDYDIMKSPNALLRNLAARGLIAPDAIGAGIRPPAPPLFPIGPLCVGERLECTAVPELRSQAASVAAAILDHLKYMDEKPAAMNY